MTASIAELTSWHADWRGLRVAVLGAGVVGFAAADTLAELGCVVRVVAESVSEERATMLDVLGVEQAVVPAEGQAAAVAAHAPDLVIASPGFHPDAPALAWAAEHDVRVSGAVGDPNVALGAIEDELRRSAADEVLISTHPPKQSNWLETGIVTRLREELDIPVTHLVIETAALR